MVALPGLILGILGFALTYALFGMANGDYNQTILWYIGGGIGFGLLIAILPLMVLSWLTLYALPIIMEYRLTAWEAVKLSAAIGRRQVFRGMVLMFVNAIPASIGMVVFVFESSLLQSGAKLLCCGIRRTIWECRTSMTSERTKANACLTLNLILPEQEPCLLARY